MTDNARAAASITPALETSVERWAMPEGAVAAIHLAPDGPDARWDTPVTAKYSGLHDIEMILREQYDGLVIVDAVSPRTISIDLISSAGSLW